MKKSASLFKALAAIELLFVVSSCVFDDRSCCHLSVRFSYTYNVKEADAFPSEVKEVELYIFDSDGRFVEKYHESPDKGFPDGYTMTLPSLAGGEYTFVALGRNRKVLSQDGEFEFAPLMPGKSGIEDLTMQLKTTNDISEKDFASIYDGVAKKTMKSGSQYIDISLNKLTNRLRLLILPYDGSDILSEDDFDFSITSSAVNFDYKGDMIRPVPTLFLPYYSSSHSSDIMPEGQTSSFVLADFQLSRLIVEDKPTLVVSSKDGGKEIARVNLAWLLSLQGIAEHRAEWSSQEYLDRQDAYNITFFIDKGTFVKSKILINGWVLSLDDVTLG
ncbi:MAG: FimB/Mfa2 family fimbrial subunit [Bacteroidales bacterium]|nr:FimB/Mfa2 family fimbrial subunit [Bacteroidales bacterium]